MAVVADIARKHNYPNIVNFPDRHRAIKLAETLQSLGHGVLIIHVAEHNVNVATDATAEYITRARTVLGI